MTYALIGLRNYNLTLKRPSLTFIMQLTSYYSSTLPQAGAHFSIMISLLQRREKLFLDKVLAKIWVWVSGKQRTYNREEDKRREEKKKKKKKKNLFPVREGKRRETKN